MANLTGRAETRLLGALISDPMRLERVPGLRPADFATRDHQLIFTAITEIAATRPGTLGSALPALIAHMAGMPEVTEDYLATLVAASHHPDHSAIYGRMVQEAALRRELAAHAERLAEAAGTVRGADPELDHLAALSSALETTTRNLRNADEVEPEPTAPRDEARILREEFLLAAVIQDPELAAVAPAWLNADLFTSPARREIYEAIVAVTQSGEPATELTIAWEIARRTAIFDTLNGRTTGTGTPGPETAVSLLADLASTPVEVTVATEIARDLLTEHAHIEIAGEISRLKQIYEKPETRTRATRSATHDATRQRELTRDGEAALIKPPAPEPGHDGRQLRQ